jgi:hypothetical protein
MSAPAGDWVFQLLVQRLGEPDSRPAGLKISPESRPVVADAVRVVQGVSRGLWACVTAGKRMQFLRSERPPRINGT